MTTPKSPYRELIAKSKAMIKAIDEILKRAPPEIKPVSEKEVKKK